MKKFFVFVLIVTMVPLLAGCAKKAKQEEPTVEADKLIGGIEGLSAKDSLTATTQGGQVSSSQMAGDVQSTDASQNTMSSGDTMMAASSDGPEQPTIQSIQEALKNAGLYSGTVDGVLGPKTKKAIREFQTMNNLNADGKVGRKTWAKLKPYLTSGAAPATAMAPAEVSN